MDVRRRSFHRNRPDPCQTERPAAVEPLEPRLLLSTAPLVAPMAESPDAPTMASVAPVVGGQGLSTADVVNIPDANLRTAIRDTLLAQGEEPSDPLTEDDLLLLTNLVAINLEIGDTTGLEHATNLTSLDLRGNLISNVSPLGGLTDLIDLWLGGNLVDDISPLDGLVNLTDLDLSSNLIIDILPLDGLANLTGLDLGGNQIVDILPLDGLTTLTGLDLSSNQVNDILPLDDLANLVVLILPNNQITNISPLDGLTSLFILDLTGNQIGNISPVSTLTSLFVLDLRDNRITDISPASGLANLDELDVGENFLYLGPGSPAMTTIGALEGGGTDVQRDSQNEPGDQLDIAYNMGSFGVSGVPRLELGSQEIGDGPYGDADVDLYKFVLSQAGRIEVDVDAQSIGSTLDGYLRLFDDSGFEIDNDDGPDPYLSPVLVAETYYVGVSGVHNDSYDATTAGTGTENGATTGPYDLRVAKGSDAPSAPDLVDGSDTGHFNNDDITMLDNSNAGNVLQFEVSGTVAGATVTIYADLTPIGTAPAGAGGTIIVETDGLPAHDLVDGLHDITARQTEVGKVESADSGTLEITVDTTPPTADVPDLAPGSDTGQFDDDDVTKGENPQFTGTADDGAGSGVWKVDVDSSDGKTDTDDAAPFFDVILPTLDEGDWTVSATVTDVAGNTFTTGNLAVTVDRTAPQVTQVFAAGTDWTAGFLTAVGDDRGWAVPDGADQLKSLPWPNLDEFKIVLDEEVVVANDDLGVYGLVPGQYTTDPAGFSYPDGDGPAGLTATWKLTGAVSLADKLLLVLSADSVTDVAGNALDGEWASGTDTYNSGDGAAGGDFAFRVNILPGDVNQDDRVTALDWISTRARTNQNHGDAGYGPLFDIDGNGKLTALDWILARVRTNTHLPPGEPTVPVQIAGVSATASSQFSPDTPADRIVDGSGLSDGLHSSDYTEMWLSDGEPSPWVQFDLGGEYLLTEMHVWNYNQDGGAPPLTKRGIQTTNVYVSATGTGDPTSNEDEWTLLPGDLLFAEASGEAGDPGESYALASGGTAARYVLLTDIVNWGGTHTGLSEVLFTGMAV